MEDDWDLQAVVRRCCTATLSSSSTATSTTDAAASATAPISVGNNNSNSSCSSSSSSSAGSFRSEFCPPQASCLSTAFAGEQVVGQLFSLPDPFEARNGIGDLHELYKPFFPRSQAAVYFSNGDASSVPALSPPLIISKEQTQPKQQQPKHGSTSTSRTKRKKNQLKRICHVPAEALSSDIWAWRKYGQKPIKGSPYPRGYYRCSSSKGCLARKQVERNKSDPGMFIVTYTAEHNHPAPTHRNSLAGSTRQKTLITPQTTGDSDKPSPAEKPTCSSSSPATSPEDELLPQSTNTESREDRDMMEDDEEDELGGFSGPAVSDDFFAGLEDFTALSTGDSFADHFPANFGLPWLSNNTATAAGGV